MFPFVALEELLQPPDTSSRSVRGDSGSVSSWSLVSGGTERVSNNASRDDTSVFTSWVFYGNNI